MQKIRIFKNLYWSFWSWYCQIVYSHIPVTAQSLSQAFASNTQGATQGGSPNNPDVGTQGFAGGNTTIATLNPNYTSAAPIIKWPINGLY